MEWNDTAAEYPTDQGLHQLFEGQVERSPNATALVFGSERLSYSELNTRANRYGRYLRKLGVTPGILVGICMERSSELVISVLAVLKAGATYVPLDPQLPNDRLAFMIEDAQCSFLLTQPTLEPYCPSSAVSCVVVDACASEVASLAGTRLSW